jgi:prepilin-type N-terminal cleavage/methylation domain-containing protein
MRHSEKRKKPGFTLIELMIVVAIIGILLAIAAFNYPKLLANLKKKACIANMRTIYGASQLALMENPNVEDLKLEFLVKQGYLKHRPQCPYAPKDNASSSVFYAIMDSVGKPLDVVCVNKINRKLAHGSLRKLLNMNKNGTSQRKW